MWFSYLNLHEVGIWDKDDIYNNQLLYVTTTYPRKNRMSALEGTDLFDLHGICIMEFIIFYYIRIKIYSCLGICIFINLYMALSINVKSLRVIREVIFSQMHRFNNELKM